MRRENISRGSLSQTIHPKATDSAARASPLPPGPLQSPPHAKQAPPEAVQRGQGGLPVCHLHGAEFRGRSPLVQDSKPQAYRGQTPFLPGGLFFPEGPPGATLWVTSKTAWESRGHRAHPVSLAGHTVGSSWRGIGSQFSSVQGPRPRGKDAGPAGSGQRPLLLQRHTHTPPASQPLDIICGLFGELPWETRCRKGALPATIPGS